MVEGERISAAGVVDVVRGIARVEPVVAGVIEAAITERRAVAVTLAGVVEDDIEHDLHPGRMQRGRCRAQIRVAAGGKIRVDRKQRDGIVTPGIFEAQQFEMPLVDPGLHRHQLDGADAKFCQMRDDAWMGESLQRTALLGRHIGMELGKGVDGEFVDETGIGACDTPLPGPPLQGGREWAGTRFNNALWHQARGIDRLLRRQGLIGMPNVGAVDAAGVGVSQQLRRIEAVTLGRIIGAVRAKTVAGAGADPGDEAVVSIAVAIRQRQARDFDVALRIKNTNFDSLGVGSYTLAF